MAGQRILIAEDEAALRKVLVLYLKEAGFEVVEAADGLRALSVLRAGGIDAAIIDVMLPGIDGFQVVREARRDLTIPLLFLTAKGEEAHRVAGLELGADDYITKPFLAHEVVARVRAHLRRAGGFAEAPKVVSHGGIEVRIDERRVLIDDDEVVLTRREFDLLAVLLRHRGRVFTREELLQLVWGSQFFTAKTVDVHVASLRRKLGDSLRLDSVRGVGYRLSAA